MDNNHPAGDELNSIQLDRALPSINRLKGNIVVIKYGGNAMIRDDLKESVATDISAIKSLGMFPVVVHGGGPAIKKLLEKVGKTTEFIGGLRKTDEETMSYVEMALSGQVNSDIVKNINAKGGKAVGLSGKDGAMVIASKQKHKVREGNEVKEVDLGQVGSIKKVNTDLIHSLINNDYVPVIAPIGAGEDMLDYNINADTFAGHIAAALSSRELYLLTDVDGLLENVDDPSSIIKKLTISEAQSHMGGIIQGGMIPKVDSCLYALNHGVQNATMLNGTKKHILIHNLYNNYDHCTTITAKNHD